MIYKLISFYFHFIPIFNKRQNKYVLKEEISFWIFLTVLGIFHCYISFSLLFSQEEYSPVRDHYTSQSEIFLCVFSLNSKLSFDEVSLMADYIKTIKGKDIYGLNYFIVLVGNKCDDSCYYKLTSISFFLFLFFNQGLICQEKFHQVKHLDLQKNGTVHMWKFLLRMETTLTHCSLLQLRDTLKMFSPKKDFSIKYLILTIIFLNLYCPNT